jgi:hypothetical protein
MYCVKALLRAIRAIAWGGKEQEDEGYIIDLAALAENIVQDQLNYNSSQEE